MISRLAGAGFSVLYHLTEPVELRNNLVTDCFRLLRERQSSNILACPGMYIGWLVASFFRPKK